MATSTINIESPMDIVLARNILRKTGEFYRWSPLFRARVVAALTALAELVMFSDANELCGLSVEVEFVQRDHQDGVEFHCHARLPDNNYTRYGMARTQLERATDELEFAESSDGQDIYARLFNMRHELVNTHHYLTFRVGGEWYGLDVDQVIEVIHFVALTEVPTLPSHVLGLLTLRNQMLPVLDLRRCFNYPAQVLKLDTPIIALNTGERSVAFVVDEVDDVVSVPGEQTADYAFEDGALVRSVLRLEDRTLLLLNLKAFEAAPVE